ncbi:amine acid ABC transporter, permease protein, 3-TM region, His/Glu/Gln/Arg/opine family [Burkholderia sp. GAS332]|nr:amine acid ABC transporter, permease protein, 3-TM region, His/Glu/Gln/Arg/opine family [Burkholderia sp. GAS332]
MERLLANFYITPSDLGLLLLGAELTIEVTIISLLIASVIGLAVGLAKISRNSAIRGAASAYISIIRGLPLLVQILYVYFGIALTTGIRIPPFTAGVVTMSIYAGAYSAEIFRSGIESIDKGQMEGALSIGLSRWQAMFHVVLPQATRRMAPTFANLFSTTLKDTSLLSVIGVTELTMAGQNIYAVNFQTLKVLTIVGGIYFAMVYALSKLTSLLQKKARNA